MKRHKRDKSNRTYDKGYQVGLAGRSSDYCPHEAAALRQHWLSGWRDGRGDQFDGLTGVSGVHKLRVP